MLKYRADPLNSKSGKLEDKWTGPYLIHEILLNGSYKLKDLEGKVFKTPTNGQWLKKYYNRESL